MKDNKKTQRRATWQKIVDEYLASDMTQKTFCEQHNISLPQFAYYHGQFKREKATQVVNQDFVPVKIPHHDKSITSSEVKLSLPNGFQCAFPIHMDAAQIKRLLEVLLSC